MIFLSETGTSISNFYELIFVVGGAASAYVIQYIKKNKSFSNKKEADRFNLSNEDLNKIIKHSVFSILRTIKGDFRMYYDSSRRKLPQKIFVYQMLEAFNILEQELKKSIERVKKNKKASKNDIIDAIKSTVGIAKETLDKHSDNLGIGRDIVRLFNQWINRHWLWYTEGTNTIIPLQDSYYDILNSHLIHSISFILAVKRDVEDSIDTYNGELTALLEDDDINKIDFSKYNFLVD
jgi:hypothetical protein